MTHSIARRSLRYWPAMVVGLGLAVVAFFLAPRLRPPSYLSEVVLSVREGIHSETVLGVEGGAESSRRRAARLQAVAVSRANLRALVEQEGIEADSVARLGFPAVVDELASRIHFEAGEGDTIIIGFVDDDPSAAQRAARRLGQLFIEQVAQASAEQAGATRRFLDDEMAKLAERLRVVEAEHAEFVALHPEFAGDRAQSPMGVRSAPGATDANAMSSAGALQRQAARLRNRLAELSNPGTRPVASTIAPPVELTPESREAIARAEQEVERAREEAARQRARFTERHPDVIAAQAQVSRYEERLAGVRRAARSLAVTSPPAPAPPLPASPEAEADLRQQLRQVEASLQAARGGTASPPGSEEDSARTIVALETKWAELSRSLETAREQHESMQRRLFNAIVADAAHRAGGALQLRVIEEAYYPKKPHTRGPRRTGGMAALALFAMGAATMFGLGFLDPRIMTRWDLAQLETGPVAMIIPALPKERRTHG